jgi:hypothetical protein
MLKLIYTGRYTVDGVALDGCAPPNENSLGVNPFGHLEKKTTAPIDNTSQRHSKLKIVDSPVARREGTPERKEDIELTVEACSSNWPSLTTCPAGYLHVRSYTISNWFMIAKLKQYAKQEFVLILTACDDTWRLQLLVLDFSPHELLTNSLRRIF